MKILLIDDHTSFCEGLIAAMATIREDYQVDFDSSAELLPEALLRKSGYDLFILDINMPGLGGVELLRYLKKNRNKTPVAVMSSVEDSATINQLYEMGIIGFFPKSYGVYQIIDAIEHCRDGEIHVPANLDITAVGGSDAVNKLPNEDSKLTKRQIEIVSLMDKGLSNQEIADTLCIGKSTVKTHIRQLFQLLGVNNRVNCLRVVKEYMATRPN